MYLAHTRLDLAYALSIVSQFMHNPGEQHMNAVMLILRYLKSAPGKGILFTKNVDCQSVDAYSDADWVRAIDDRLSTSRYFTFVGGNLVTWRSKKQNVVTRSSAEAEFRGMTLRICEALWLRLLLMDLGYLPRQPIRLYCDNKATCDIAHNPVQHDRTKHVEVDRFFIKEKLDKKIVELHSILSFLQRFITHKIPLFSSVFIEQPYTVFISLQDLLSNSLTSILIEPIYMSYITTKNKLNASKDQKQKIITETG